MGALDGVRIAVLEARRPEELVSLLERHGASVCVVPAVQEASVPAEPAVGVFLDRLAAGAFTTVIFLTGVGVTALFQVAERLNRRDELVAGLAKVALACRGPKPRAALKPYGLATTYEAAPPYTTRELLEALGNVAGQSIAVVHYGERNQPLVAALQAGGAWVDELMVYEWRLPADLAPLQRLVDDLLAGKLDVVLFTSQIQARHLFQVAAARQQATALAAALNTHLVVASVGPVCTAALAALGVHPQVEPENPKMGPLVNALARYLYARRRS